MRSSDLSSDVGSSDLEHHLGAPWIAEGSEVAAELLPVALLPEHRGAHRLRLAEHRGRILDHHVHARDGSVHRLVAAVHAHVGLQAGEDLVALPRRAALEVPARERSETSRGGKKWVSTGKT